jgi:hypothetical protein
MKCFPEIIDLWNLYADYFLRRVFGCFREAKFFGVRPFGVCSTTLGGQENAIWVYKIFILISLLSRALSVMALSL